MLDRARVLRDDLRDRPGQTQVAVGDPADVDEQSDEEYAALSTDEQIAFLSDIAGEGAQGFGLEPVQIDLARHAFNTTFRVRTADRATVAVRVNTNSVSAPAHIRAQHSWMRSLAAQTELRLPVPIQTPSGEDLAVVSRTGHDHLVVAATWLEGDEVEECNIVQARMLGAAMGVMHEHATGWAVPEGADLATFSDPFFGDEDRLRGAYADRPEDLALVEWSLARCQAALSDALSCGPRIVIHGDLHGGNLLWHEGVLAVLDFDDCGVAVPALDLAVAIFYLRGSDPRIEDALREGYAGARQPPGGEGDDFEALVACRQLLLANDLLRSRTPELRALSAPYLDRTVERLGRWRETGRFTL